MKGVAEEKGERGGYDSQRYGAMATHASGGGGGGDGLDSSQDEQASPLWDKTMSF